MKSTMLYAAKRALFDLLAANTDVGEPFEGIQIAYSYPVRDPTRKMIYFGGARLVHTDEAEEQGLVGSETVSLGVYFRVMRPDADVRAAETDVEVLADALTALMEVNPKLGGTLTWLGVASGNADYAETPDGPEAVLALQVLIGAVLI